MTKNANYSVGEPMPNLGELLIAAREKYGLPEMERGAFTSFQDGK